LRPFSRFGGPAWAVALRWAPPVAIFAVALALGAYRIGAKSFWHDEAVTAWFARQGPVGILQTAPSWDANFSLYYLLISFWAQLVGFGEGLLRAPSAVCAAASAATLYVATRRIEGRGVAAGASLLLVTSEQFLNYAQEARPYALALLMVTASMLAVVLVAEKPQSRWRLAAFACTGMLALYSHLFSGFVVATEILWLFTKSRRSAMVVGLSLGPLVSPLLVYGLFHGTPGWIPTITLNGLTWTFLSLAGGSWPVLIAAAALVLRGLWLAARGRRSLTLPLASAVLPMVALVAVSIVQPALVTRYLLFTLPGLAIVCSVGALSLRPRPVGAVALAGVLVVNSITGLSWYTGHPKDDVRNMVAVIVRNSNDGDMIIFYPTSTWYETDYYLRRTSSQLVTATVADVAASCPSSVWVAMNYQWTGSTPAEVWEIQDGMLALGYHRTAVPRLEGLRLVHYVLTDEAAHQACLTGGVP
jgi:uncharacterized membrane protein